MNYIHVHEKCLKCGECRLECEHRTKWTSASTSTPPNTESDKSIDEILNKLVETYYNPTPQDNPFDKKRAKEALYSLLMDVIEIDPANRFNCEALRIEQRTKLKELFNVKEK